MESADNATSEENIKPSSIGLSHNKQTVDVSKATYYSIMYYV